ncbi:hypothetical protein C5C49_04745, partial [Rathayibacter sp. AY1E2]
MPTGAAVPMEGVCTMNQRPPDAWNRSAAATRTASRAVVVPIRAVRRRDRRTLVHRADALH